MGTNILVFGDSIPYGHWDTQGGWVDRLKKDLGNTDFKIYQKAFNNVYNLGISGGNTEYILNRFENETKPRHWLNHNLVLIFQVGLNDSTWDNDANKPSYTESEFKKNLSKLLTQSRKRTSKIFFLGLTPVEESKVDPMPWNKQLSYKNNLINRYDQIIKEFCSKQDIVFIDLLTKFNKHKPNDLLKDGVHPNTKGHELIYKTVNKSLLDASVI